MYFGLWVAFWVFWPVIALLGGQGASPVIGLLAIAGLWSFRKGLPFRLYAVPAVLFVIWAAVTSLWSPEANGVFTWDPDTKVMAIEADGLRILLMLLVIPVISGAMTMTTGRSRVIEGLIPFTVGISLLIITIQAAYTGEGENGLWFVSSDAGGNMLATQFPELRDWATTNQDDVVQNIIKNMTLATLALPLAAACVLRFNPIVNSALVLGFGAIAFVVANDIWAQAAAVSLGAAMVGALLVAIVGRWMLGIFGVLTAGYVAATPFAMPYFISWLKGSGIALPPSFEARALGWEYTIDRFWEQPVLGWGIEAAKGWTDLHPVDHPTLGGLNVVASHPHNMPLQIWSETGVVGAALAAIAVLALGLRLALAKHLYKRTAIAIGAFWMAAMVFVSASYSVWNDAFWSAIAFLSTGLVAINAANRLR